MTQLNLKEVSKLGKLGERLNLKLSSKAFSHIKGEYHSKFRGEGLDFDSVRKYIPGDDIRNIDWKVTARTGKTHIKLFNEDRSREIYFIIDLSHNLLFGTKGYLKAEQAIFSASIIAFAALANKDKVGAYIFSDLLNKQYFLKAKNSETHILRILDNSLRAFTDANEKKQQKAKTTFSTQLFKLNKTIAKNSIIIILTHIPELTHDIACGLKKLSYKRHIELLNMTDPSDITLPLINNLHLQNGSNKEIISITRDVQKKYEENYKIRNQELITFCHKYKINYQNIHTDQPIFNQIQTILR